MATVIAEHVVCTDCIIALVNDDTSGAADPTIPLSLLGNRDIVPGNAANDEDFSHERCVGCGTTAGGTRHAVVEFGLEQRPDPEDERDEYDRVQELVYGRRYNRW